MLLAMVHQDRLNSPCCRFSTLLFLVILMINSLLSSVLCIRPPPNSEEMVHDVHKLVTPQHQHSQEPIAHELKWVTHVDYICSPKCAESRTNHPMNENQP